MQTQRSDEWFEMRLGCVTASRAKDILAQGRRKTVDCDCGNQRAKPPKCSKCGAPVYLEPGESYKSYRREVLMGRKYAIPISEIKTAELEHGIEFEDEAIAFYEFKKQVKVERVMFLMHPAHAYVGCSPDGLVGADGQIEVKCPFPRNHMKHLDGEIEDYLPQIDFQLGVTGRLWCDFISYSNDERFGADQLYVQRVLAAHRQEEIAHVMAVANRLSKEVDDMLGDRTDVDDSRTEAAEDVPVTASGGQTSPVGDYAGGRAEPVADSDIPF